MVLPNLNISIPAGLNTLETWYVNLDEVPTGIATQLAANGMESSQVKSIVPAQARLVSIFGDQDYNFVFEVVIYLCNAGATSDECGSEVFYRVPVPENTGLIVDVIPNEFDVKSYLLQEEVNIQLAFRFRQPPPQFVDTRVELTFGVR